uniref:FBD domain-containing protein n=1 Tax=Leersia perrieri TaxID=77586 RepID=A0A0D9WVR4_9ORYZ
MPPLLARQALRPAVERRPPSDPWQPRSAALDPGCPGLATALLFFAAFVTGRCLGAGTVPPVIVAPLFGGGGGGGGEEKGEAGGTAARGAGHERRERYIESHHITSAIKRGCKDECIIKPVEEYLVFPRKPEAKSKPFHFIERVNAILKQRSGLRVQTMAVCDLENEHLQALLLCGVSLKLPANFKGFQNHKKLKLGYSDNFNALFSWLKLAGLNNFFKVWLSSQPNRQHKPRTTLPEKTVKFMYMKHLRLELTFCVPERKADILDFACLLEAPPCLETLGLHLVCHILRNSVMLNAIKIDPRPVVAVPPMTFIWIYEVAMEYVGKEDHRNVVDIYEIRCEDVEKLIARWIKPETVLSYF